MKICVAGAGSTRLPLMMASITAAGRPIDEVTLFDVRPERIRTLLPIGLRLAEHVGHAPLFRIADSLEDAVQGCDALILTIRPGFEEQRARDERTCLDLGVIGQETTGPAGFAFATRTIPAVAHICFVARRLAPGFLPVIFTNPAGMVTRAMIDLGFENAVGICDSATVAAGRIAGKSGLQKEDADFEVSGLNHLSWTRRVAGPDGTDLMTPALNDPDFMSNLLPWVVDPSGTHDGIPVEYLYYYMRAGDALKALLSEPLLRGEALVAANTKLFRNLNRAGRPEAVDIYASWLAERNGTYMSYALGPGAHSATTPGSDPLEFLAGQIGGYAEVAMELLASSYGENDRVMALNVKNNGAIPELPDHAVVETDCIVNRQGVRPRPHAPMPTDQAALVTRVARYEDLAIRAVFFAMSGHCDDARQVAVLALESHPLVPDRNMALRLAESLFGDKGLSVQVNSDIFLTIPDTRP